MLDMKSFLNMLFFIGLGLGQVTAQSSVPSYVPLTNLIAYYSLDGNVKNALDTTLHIGTATNAIPVADRFNQPQKAYYLNGTNAYLTIPSSVMNQVTGAYSVSIWHFIDSTFTHRPLGYELIADRSVGTWLYRFRIGYGYDNPPRFNMDSSYFDRTVGSNNEPRFAARNPNIDGWTHFVVTFSPDSGGTMTGYIDGVMVGRKINAGNVAGGRQINVGHAVFPGSGISGGGNAKGNVDEIGIWSRALSFSEVQQLFNSCEIQITTSPQAATTTIGGTAQFNVSVATPGVTYQWQIDSSGIGAFQNIAPSTQFAGTTSATLMIQNASRNLHQTRYRCLISGSNCSISSETVPLNVVCPALITQQPVAVNGVEGDTILFSTNLIAGASYAWQIDLGNGFNNLSNTGLIAGVNTHELRIFGLNFALDSANVRCIVDFEGCVDTSATVLITTRCGKRITVEPNDVNTVAGSVATFQVQAVAGITNYQWYQNQGFGFLQVPNTGRYGGAQTNTLNIYNVLMTDHLNSFMCVVTENNCLDSTMIVNLNVIGGVSVETLAKDAFSVYPNPVSSQLVVKFDGSLAPKFLTLLNAQGGVVDWIELESGRSESIIDVSGLANGLYLLQSDLGTKRFLVKH